MESRKMVLMNLFSEQQLRCRHKKQIYGQREGQGKGGMNGESCTETYALPSVK